MQGETMKEVVLGAPSQTRGAGRRCGNPRRRSEESLSESGDMLVKEWKRSAQEVPGMLERASRNQCYLRGRAADAERAPAERSLDRTHRITKRRGLHVVVEK